MIRFIFALLVLIATPVYAQQFSACVTPRSSRVIATSATLVDTTLVTVSSPPTITPVVEENYTYTSVQAFTSTTKNSTVYAQSPVIGFESTCNALQYTLIPNTTTPLCSKYYMGYDLDFPQPLPEVYVEMWVKWDSSFTTQRPASDGPSCDIPCDYPPRVGGGMCYQLDKSGVVLMLGRVNNLSGAFGVTIGTGWPYALRAGVGHPCFFNNSGTSIKQLDEDEGHTCNYGLLDNEYTYRIDKGLQNGIGSFHVQGDTRYTNMFSSKLMQFDGKWHRYRYFFKAANGTYPNGSAISLWVDDSHLGTITDRDTVADKLIGLSIGRFMWQQPVRNEFIQIGRVRVWSANPGWDLCEAFCSGGAGPATGK